MRKTPVAALYLGEYGCEDCVFLALRRSDAASILDGRVPCFACDAALLYSGEREYRQTVDLTALGQMVTHRRMRDFKLH
jgi:hypothetical protein